MGRIITALTIPLISIILGWIFFILSSIGILKLLEYDIGLIQNSSIESIIKTLFSLIIIMVWLISWHYVTKYLRNRYLR